MNGVSKIVARCACFILMPVIFLGYNIDRDMLALVDGECPYYIWNREKSNNLQDKTYRVIVLGDSGANAAYMPEALSADTINLSLGGTTPMENYYTLKDWVEHNPAPEVCYISFGDGHMKSSDCFWTRSMFSHRYSLAQEVEMLKAAYFYQEPSIIDNPTRVDYAISQMYLPKNYISSIWNGSFYNAYEANEGAMRSDELHFGRYIARTTNEYNATDEIVQDEFYASPLFDEYYRKTIELCVKNGITPRVVKLPLPDNNTFTEKYISEFNEYYNGLKREYPSLTVDWSIKTRQKDRFTDGVHMNSHGALQFSLELRERYPEDFSASEPDEGQIAALDDSIRAENKIEWILKWVGGRDYTVLFYDKRGDFRDKYEDRFQEEWETEGFNLAAVSIEEAEAEEGPDAPDGGNDAIAGGMEDLPEKRPNVWMISGTGSGASATLESVAVSMGENGLTLQLDGQEPQAWETASDDILGVAVINNYNDALVCLKAFHYVNGRLQLA